MKNDQMPSVKDGGIKEVLPTKVWQQPVLKPKLGSTARTLMTMATLFVIGSMLLPTASFAQKKKAVTKKVVAKKKHKVLGVLTLKKDDGDEDGPNGVKDRLEYEFNRTKDPATNTVPEFRLMNAFNKHNQSVTAQKTALRQTNGIGGAVTNGVDQPIQTTPWIERGPNISKGPNNDNNPATSGRADAFWADIDPSKPNQAFLGADNGGLWTCPDVSIASPAWTFIDNFASIAISSICQDPTNPNIIYFGTGDKLSGRLGGGIWKSTDHGVTFSFLASTTTFYNIDKVLCDKNGYLYAGMVQYVKTGSDYTNGGLMQSKDGGATWTDITPTIGGIVTRNVSDMVYDASIDRLGVFMGLGFTQGQAIGYCYGTPSTVSSGTWNSPASAAVGLGMFVQANGTTPTIRQTVMSAKGGIVWALQGYSDAPTTVNGGSFTNLYFSADGGATWALKKSIDTNYVNFDFGQNWYCLGIDCDPMHPSSNVVIGGFSPYKSTDGGATLTQLARWVGDAGAGPTAQFVHADIHKIIYNTNASGLNRVICMDDGGINFSADGGATWQDRNVGLRTTEFYSVAANPADPNYFLAGAQDNGDHQFTQAGLGNTFQVSGGDGAFVAIDQLNPNNQITTYTFNNYQVSTDNGVKLNKSYIAVDVDKNGMFINPYDLDSKTKKVYASDTAGKYLRWDDPFTTQNTFNKIAVPAIGSSVISAITVSPNLNNTIYLAAGGIVVKATNANTATPTFTTITPPTVTANSNISSIVLGPSTTDQDMIVTSSSFGTNKVFISANGGSTWTDITGNLPDLPVNWSLFYPGSNTKVYIGTKVGLWYTTAINGASTVWQADVTIPKVDCKMLKYNAATNSLVLATYGRGLWTAKISTNPKVSFYPALLSTSKSFSNTTANCRSYFDYSDSLLISDPPTGAATATLSVQSGGTARLGSDFDFTTNGSFTSPSTTATFANGTYPNKIPINIRVYNNKDKNVTSPLTVNLGIAISGTTDAQPSSANQTLLINLADSLKPIPTSTVTNQTVWTENWESWPSTKSSWVFSPDYTTPSLNATLFYPNTIGGCGGQSLTNVNVELFGTDATGALASCGGLSASSTPIFYRAVNANAGYYANMKVTFDYISLNGADNNNLVYSINNGSTWTTIQSFPTQATAKTVTVAIPATLNNTNFLLGWSSSGASLSGFDIDNITVVGDVTPPAIETTVSSASNYYVNSGTNIDAFSTNNKIFANISNPSADLGCVTASIENAGNTWQPFLGGFRSQKTFLVTPTTNASGTTYQATFYFTTAELAGLAAGNLKLAKTEATNILLATALNTVAITPSTTTYNTTGVAFTGTFTGFSRYFLADMNVMLPISLVSFTGSLVGQNTVLDWVTATETNNKEFDVQWSTDGINFTTVGVVPSQGNSTTNVSYTFTHDHPSDGVNYYRLKQVDKDGTSTYSSIVIIKVSVNDGTMPSLYPNPAQKSITLNLGSVVPQADMSLYSIDMRLLRKQNLVGTSPTTTIDISQLPAGVYYMQVNKNGNKVMLRFVKE